ncbi:MAG TPA: nickel pincer cofactor biosynthesis protein LarB [Peptococcaceae bacterium]|nr:MAG: NCAIR mutase (PurE)-related protein-like protein [Clostridia bacterium 41_269]HBT19806.1 nickel pincer cofactor biosynthesis protein LarB [Peptococcaceae bacterium]
MKNEELRRLFIDVKEGRLSIDEAVEAIKYLPYEDLGFAKTDHHRALRKGMPEVILGMGKSPLEVQKIALSLWEKGNSVLITRAGPEHYHAVVQKIPNAEYFEKPGIIAVKRTEALCGGTVSVISAGTSDLKVAEEAAVTLEFLGVKVNRFYDVGVAGIHRLLDKIKEIEKGQVIIVVAGMEGALPSVVAGMVEKPVIAVPTSIGYGASFNGLAALLAMLNSCASGVGVVNIDNGFGAAALAYSIIKTGCIE